MSFCICTALLPSTVLPSECEALLGSTAVHMDADVSAFYPPHHLKM